MPYPYPVPLRLPTPLGRNHPIWVPAVLEGREGFCSAKKVPTSLSVPPGPFHCTAPVGKSTATSSAGEKSPQYAHTYLLYTSSLTISYHIISDQTRPDQTRPDQTRPDQTRPDHHHHHHPHPHLSGPTFIFITSPARPKPTSHHGRRQSPWPSSLSTGPYPTTITARLQSQIHNRPAEPSTHHHAPPKPKLKSLRFDIIFDHNCASKPPRSPTRHCESPQLPLDPFFPSSRPLGSGGQDCLTHTVASHRQLHKRKSELLFPTTTYPPLGTKGNPRLQIHPSYRPPRTDSPTN